MSVIVEKSGPSGNIFEVIGRAKAEMVANGKGNDVGEMINRATSAHSYEEALEIISEYVELIIEE
jgi:thymidylate synthase